MPKILILAVFCTRSFGTIEDDDDDDDEGTKALRLVAAVAGPARKKPRAVDNPDGVCVRAWESVNFVIDLIVPLRMLVWPPGPFSHKLTHGMIACLDEGEFLNDVIINFYLQYLIDVRCRVEP
jgi:hypothetical protein